MAVSDMNSRIIPSVRNLGERLNAALCRRLGHKRRRSLLVVGHPRNGTGFVASLLQEWGLAVGHEEVMSRGVCSWYADLETTPPLCRAIAWDTYSFEHVVHVVRDPLDAVFSVAFTEATTDRFRLQYLGMTLTNNRFLDALSSLEGWYRRIRSTYPESPVFRIENDLSKIFDYLVQIRLINGVYAPSRASGGRYNSRRSEYAGIDVHDLVRQYRSRLEWVRELYGYAD